MGCGDIQDFEKGEKEADTNVSSPAAHSLVRTENFSELD